jgi:site-specific DNA-cytosine methylase
MLQLVKRLLPAAFLIENVPGLVNWQNGHMGNEILSRFEGLDYTVGKSILLAADYGVPQRRRRLSSSAAARQSTSSSRTDTHGRRGGGRERFGTSGPLRAGSCRRASSPSTVVLNEGGRPGRCGNVNRSRSST